MSARTASADPVTVIEALPVELPRAFAVLCWQWRTELGYLATLALLIAALMHTIGTAGTIVAFSALVAGVVFLPAARRLVARQFGRLKTRHGLHAVFARFRIFSRAGRYPLILRIRCTPVGERALVWCRPGTCPDDLAIRTEYLAAACWARDVRVTRNPRFAQLAIVEVIRRDPLAATTLVPSPLPAYATPAVRPDPEPVAEVEPIPIPQAVSEVPGGVAHAA